MTATSPRSKKVYSLKYEDNLGLVHLQAKLGYRWAQQAGATLDYEDLFQEASIAFLKAAEGFDSSKDITFSAYFTKVCFSQFRKAIGTMTGVKNLSPEQRAEIIDRKAENARRAAAAEEQLPDVTYGLRAVPFSALVTGVDDESTPFEQTLMADTLSPEEELVARAERRAALARASLKLSPLARLVVEWLIDPPPELVAELQGLEALADRLQNGERAGRGWKEGLTIANIGRFLELLGGRQAHNEFALVKHELEQLMEQA